MVQPANGFLKVVAVISTPGLESRNHGFASRVGTKVADRNLSLTKTDLIRSQGRDWSVRSPIETKPTGPHASLMGGAIESQIAPTCTSRRIFHPSREGGIQ